MGVIESLILGTILVLPFEVPLGPFATEPTVAVEEFVVPWDGITVEVESFLRNDRTRHEIVETLRENFVLDRDFRSSLDTKLSAISRKEWLEYNNRYRYFTVALIHSKTLGGYGDKYLVTFYFHNAPIEE